MFSTSPAKYTSGNILLRMVLKSTSFRSTPPAVTNSSLKVLLPRISNCAWQSCCANWLICVLERSAHLVSLFMHVACTMLSHNRLGMLKGDLTDTVFWACCSFCDLSFSRVDSIFSVCSQFTTSVNAYCLTCKIRAPQADNFKIAGPLMPQCVINK